MSHRRHSGEPRASAVLRSVAWNVNSADDLAWNHGQVTAGRMVGQLMGLQQRIADPATVDPSQLLTAVLSIEGQARDLVSWSRNVARGLVDMPARAEG